MAYETGTATDYLDLFEKFRTFITSGVALGSQAWTELEYDNEVAIPGQRHLYLRGPGLAGLDEIYIQMKTFEDVNADYFNFGMNYAVGYNEPDDYENQPGVSSAVYSAFWNNSMPYWFVADGRHFVIAANVSGTYHMMYGGFYLPYGTPSEMPYPIMVGGESGSATYRWSTNSEDIYTFFDPGNGALKLRHVDGTEISFRNGFVQSGNNRTSESVSNVWPWSDNQISSHRNCIDGSYALIQSVLHSSSNDGNVYGEIPDIYWISGFGNASENTLTINSVDYVVLGNVFRANINNYCALRLG